MDVYTSDGVQEFYIYTKNRNEIKKLADGFGENFMVKMPPPSNGGYFWPVILCYDDRCRLKTGRSIVVVFMLWEHAVRVRFSAPRTKERSE